MDKLPRSGPLYNAVEEIYLRKNLFDETRTMSEVIKDAAKKNNVSVEQLKNVLPDANQIFEGGPLSNPKPEVFVKNSSGAGKFSKELPRAQAMADEIRKVNRVAAPSVKELTQVSGGMNTLGKVVGPAIAVAQGATVAQGIMDKMKAGESFKEAATNPELVKDAARGALGYLGADAGALAGSMVPGGLPAKAGAELAGAVGGGYLGAKLADLLTGNPIVDKIIRAQYEKARNERMAKTKPTAASSVGLRPGE
jgi:uncharacterized protein YcfJ